MSKRELRLSDRMVARSRAAADGGLTEEDQKNLKDYATKLDEAISLIRQEIASIVQGDLGAVNELYAQKAELLKWLELRAPTVEPFLGQPVAQEHDLPGKLATFKSVLQEDGDLLKRMAGVAASITREIEKVINRDSLDGLYGKSGEKLSKSGQVKMKLDHEI